MANTIPPSGLFQVSRFDVSTQRYVPTGYINLPQQEAEEIAKDLNHQY